MNTRRSFLKYLAILPPLALLPLQQKTNKLVNLNTVPGEFDIQNITTTHIQSRQIHSLRSGQWNDATIWENNQVPQNGDIAVILHHDITIEHDCPVDIELHHNGPGTPGSLYYGPESICYIDKIVIVGPNGPRRCWVNSRLGESM